MTENRNEGDFGGLAGADRMCQDEADATPDLAGGIYRAWLSTSTESPSTRFNHVASSGPFRQLNNEVIANTWADLISGTGLLNRFNILANGTEVFSSTWTNTTATGEPAGGQDCNGWTSGAFADTGRVGITGTTGSGWTDNTIIECNFRGPLYCIEQR